MATTVQNPFDTQQPAATNPSPGGLIASSLPASNQVMNYTPETRQVNQATDTVQGQVNSILSKDGPLMQRARTLATQNMAQRGLVNSSMAQGAGVAAMTDRALPMAQQDANTYSAVAADNMTAKNASNQFNAGSFNQFGLQKGQQDFEAGQLQKQQQFATSERVGSQSFAAQQQSAQNTFVGAQSDLDRATQRYQTDKSIESQKALQAAQQNFAASQSALDRSQQTNLQTLQNDFNKQMQQLQESGMNSRQATDIASRDANVRLEQAGITNRFDKELALKSSQFNIEQNNLERRQLLQNQAEMDRLGLQIQANRDSIPTNFAANISNTTMAGVNAIMADGNMSADAKKGAISNLVNYANSQISWAEKFYGSTIPRITTPA